MGLEFDKDFWIGWGIAAGMTLFMGVMIWLGSRNKRR